MSDQAEQQADKVGDEVPTKESKARSETQLLGQEVDD